MKKYLVYSLIGLTISIGFPSFAVNNILNDESALKMSVSGKYDKKNKYVIHQIPLSITKRFEMTNFDPYMTSVVLNKSFNENGKLKQILVTQSKDKTSECHGCSPIIGISTFVKNNNKWIIENKLDYVEKLGTWGKSPKPDLVEIGKNNYGLIFEDGYTGMGMTTNRTYIIGKVNNKFKTILALDNTYTDNAGACGEELKQLCYKFNSTYSFIKNNDKFYPLTFTYKGTNTDGNEKIISANKIEKYTFIKDKYVLKK